MNSLKEKIKELKNSGYTKDDVYEILYPVGVEPKNVKEWKMVESVIKEVF